MQIIVSDTSCIIDLRNGALLASLFRLPYEFVIPEELFHYELLSFSESEKRFLVELGLQPKELSGQQMTSAQAHFNAEHRKISLRDSYALALAESMDEAILLTGDGNLRQRSRALDIRTHGVIWVIDQLLYIQEATNLQFAI